MGIIETMARKRSRTSMGQGMGEDNNVGIGRRENAGMDTHVGIAEEQRAKANGQSTYTHSKPVL
jgi:hypothetical protein